MRYILKGNFNPINNKQLVYINQIKKENKIDEIYLFNDGENRLFDVSIKEYDSLYKISEEDIEDYDEINIIPDIYFIDYADGDFREFSTKVIEYIFENVDILTEVPRRLLSENRFKHSVSVAKTAVNISECNNINVHEAYIAGLLHDICKEMDHDIELEWIVKYFPQYSKINRKIFHQFTAYIFIKDYMKYNNVNVLDAILHHVLGSSMKPLGMTLYIADKIEPLRGYNTEKEVQLYKKSLESCFKVVKATQAKYYEKELKNDKKRVNN